MTLARHEPMVVVQWWCSPLALARLLLAVLAVLAAPGGHAVNWDARWDSEVHKLFSPDYMTYSRLKDVVFGGCR